MSHYVWTGDIMAIGKAPVFEDTAWLTGKKLAEPLKLPVFPRTRLRPVALPDVISIEFGLLIISARARSVLEAAGVDNLEYMPVRIRPRRGKVMETGHCMINVVGRLDCLDRAHSDVTTFHGSDGVSSLYRYRLRAVPAQAPHIFRLSDFRWHTLVDASVKAACEAAKLTGSRIVATEAYKGYS